MKYLWTIFSNCFASKKYRLELKFLSMKAEHAMRSTIFKSNILLSNCLKLKRPSDISIIMFMMRWIPGTSLSMRKSAKCVANELISFDPGFLAKLGTGIKSTRSSIFDLIKFFKLLSYFRLTFVSTIGQFLTVSQYFGFPVSGSNSSIKLLIISLLNIINSPRKKNFEPIIVFLSSLTLILNSSS